MSDDKPRPGEETNLAELPVLRHHEERRRYPRVDLRVPVILTSRGRQVLRGWTRNISTDGLQVRLDRQAAKTLHPAGTHIPPGAGPSVMLRCELPLRGKARPFVALGRLTYIAVCRQDEIAFGIQFTRIELRDKAVLASFITEALRPPPE